MFHTFLLIIKTDLNGVISVAVQNVEQIYASDQQESFLR